jgi:hypothetical protein
MASPGICICADVSAMRSFAQLATTGTTIYAIASVNPNNVLLIRCGTNNFAPANVPLKIVNRITTGTQ